jgi:ribose transport system permease protein
MSLRPASWTVNIALSLMPWLFLAGVVIAFGLLSERFLTVGNLAAILAQSSWLIVVALGMNFILLSSGVDLSVGAGMYLAAVVIGTRLASSPWWLGLLVAIIVGCVLGAVNGFFVVKFRLPSFIVTLASAFIARGLGLYLSSTRIVFAGTGVAELGRDKFLGVSVSLIFAGIALCCAGLLLRETRFGLYIRSIGVDAEGARKAGVPVDPATWTVFVVCGGFAAFGGFILVSQTSAASAAFGQNAEFLAIAAAVLGGTSLFGGRGTLLAPIIGAFLIMTVQNGLAVINANPYAYPVIIGLVIFLAALLDSCRLWLAVLARRRNARDLAQKRLSTSAGVLLDDVTHN